MGRGNEVNSERVTARRGTRTVRSPGLLWEQQHCRGWNVVHLVGSRSAREVSCERVRRVPGCTFAAVVELLKRAQVIQRKKVGNVSPRSAAPSKRESKPAHCHFVLSADSGFRGSDERARLRTRIR